MLLPDFSAPDDEDADFSAPDDEDTDLSAPDDEDEDENADLTTVSKINH
jgi:hypothetical protein